MAFRGWFAQLVINLLHCQEAIFPVNTAIDILTSIGLTSKVRSLRRAALSLFTLAVVLAVEEVVGADWHLCIVLLLHSVAVLVGCSFWHTIIPSFVHDLAVDVARCVLFFVRCNFINILIS